MNGIWTWPGTEWSDLSSHRHRLLFSDTHLTNKQLLPVGLVHTQQKPASQPWNDITRTQARLVYVKGLHEDGAIDRLAFFAFQHNAEDDLIEAGDFVYRKRPLAGCSINDLRRIQFGEQYHDENSDGTTNWNTPLERVLKRVARDYMFKFSPEQAESVLGKWYSGRRWPVDA